MDTLTAAGQQRARARDGVNASDLVIQDEAQDVDEVTAKEPQRR